MTEPPERAGGRSPRRLRWWLGGTGMLALVLAIAAWDAVVAIDPNDYKASIIDAVQDATGRTLSLNGPLRVTWSLWPTLQVNNVALANLPGGTRPDMARAERIEAQVSLLALLWHRIEVVELTLIGPNILFEQVGGASNWIFNRPATEPRPISPYSLRIRNAHVLNGMVTWRLPNRTKVVGMRVLDVQHHVDDGPLRLDGTLVYSDNQPFSLKASAEPTAGFGGSWHTRIDFAAYDTVASATGTMDVAGVYDLHVDGTSGALEALNALLPEMRLPALHRVTLASHLTNGAQPGDLPVIGETRLHFDGADLGGRLPGLQLGATDVSLPAAGGAATLATSGRYGSQAFTLGGTFGVPTHPDGRARVPIDLTARLPAGAGELTAKGSVALERLHFAGLAAAISLQAPKLAAFRSITAKAPALNAIRLDARLTLPADLAAVAFTGLKMQAQEGDLSGQGLVGLGSQMTLDAKLQSGHLDLDAVLGAFETTLPAAPHGGAPGPSISDAALPWEALRGPAIDITGQAGTVRFQGEDWRDVETIARLKAGRLELGSLKVMLPGGPVAVTMTADASRTNVPVSLEMQASGIPLPLIARYAGLPQQVVGNVRLDAKLQATGRSLHELAATLDGPVSATMVGGRLSNAAFVALAAASLEALSIKVPASGETELRCAGLIGAFDKGVGRFKTIALDTTYLQLTGMGQIDLGAETVALKLNPITEVSGSPVAVPVLVTGPFRALHGRLDADGLDKVGLFIDGLFGGDHPNTCADAGLVVRPAARP